MKHMNLTLVSTMLLLLFLAQFTTACVKFNKNEEATTDNFVKVDSFWVVGYSLKSSFENDAYEKDVEKLWKHLEEEFDAKLFHSRANDRIYVVTYNYKEDNGKERFEVLLGYKVTKPTSSLKSKFASVKIPSQKYYQATASGTTEEEVVKTWQKIFMTVENRSYAYDFEAYSLDDDFEVTKIEIFTSVIE